MAAFVKKRVHVCRAGAGDHGGLQVELQIMEVPRSERYGPWQRRPWLPRATAEGGADKAIFEGAEILTPVELEDSVLTMKSLADLQRLGCDLSALPSLAATLPPPTI